MAGHDNWLTPPDLFRWRAGEMKKPPHIWWWKWRNTPNNGEQKGARPWAIRERKPPAPLFAVNL